MGQDLQKTNSFLWNMYEEQCTVTCQRFKNTNLLLPTLTLQCVYCQRGRNEPPLPLQILLACEKSRNFFLLLPSYLFSPIPSFGLPLSNVNACTSIEQWLPNEAAAPHLFHPLLIHHPPGLNKQERGKGSQSILSPDHR